MITPPNGPEDLAVKLVDARQVDVLIRYNTRQDNTNPAPWRVLIAEEISAQHFDERFAINVIIAVPSRTSEDLIAPGVMKWHLRARGYVSWVGDVCYVTDRPAAHTALL